MTQRRILKLVFPNSLFLGELTRSYTENEWAISKHKNVLGMRKEL